MTKSPYEIRLDVLQMAKDMLQMETELKVKALEMQNEALRATNEWAKNDHITAAVSTASFSSADLTNRASELYKFVNNNSRTSD